MIKRIFYTLVAVFLMTATMSFADDVNPIDYIKKLPALNQAVIFSLDDNEFQYATTVTLVSLLEDKIKVDFGYTPRQELIGLASFKLLEVKDYITFPILDLVEIEPFVYIGLDRIALNEGNEDSNNEIDYGLGVKLLSIKF